MHRNTENLSKRVRSASAALRISTATIRLQLSYRYNPNWQFQPRVSLGNPDGGQWLAGAFGAAVNALPALIRVGLVAVRRLLGVARTTAPRLRGVPRRWEGDQPHDDTYDSDTMRISPYSRQRPGLPSIRFRNERELRHYLGPAGSNREWHHIVEKRLAGREGFPAELIHSTDNIISLPIEVHRYINMKMSSKSPEFGGEVRRFWVEKLPFGEQYDHGLQLIEEALRKHGYDPEDF